MTFLITLPSGERKLVSSPKADLLIGRSRDCEVVVDEPAVSRRHAEVFRQAERYFVRDAGSQNGTTVNDQRIAGPKELAPGARIGVGGVTIVFEPMAAEPGFQGRDEVDPTATLAVRLPPAVPGSPAASLELLQAVADSAARIVQDGPLEGVLDTILRLCLQRVRAERAAILLRDDQGELALRAYVAQGNPASGLNFSRSIVRKAIDQRAALLVKDAAGDEALRDSASIIGLRLHSAICTPLVNGETLLGALYADTSRPDHQFGEAELLFVASLAGMIAEKIENAMLADVAREKRRQDAELTRAAQIQARLMPTQLPRIDGYDLAVFYRPRIGVGGDYFDLIPVGGLFGMAIGDVIGHGLGAALLMANLQATVRARAVAEVPPERLLWEVNADLAGRVDDGMFITFCFLTLHPGSGRIVYASAGHPPPLLGRAEKTVCRCADSGGIPLGIFGDSSYAPATAELRPGDALLLYSDGITEAASGSGALFGEERLGAALAASVGSAAEGIRDGILAAVASFSGVDLYADDVTLIVLKRN